MNAPLNEDVDDLMTRMGRAAREASRVLAKADKSHSSPIDDVERTFRG